MTTKRFLSCALALSIALTASSQELRRQTGIFGAGQPGEVAVVRMEAKKLGLQDFQMESRQVDGRLAIDGFTARLGSGTMQGRGLVDWSQPNNLQRMTIHVQNVEAMALLSAFKVKLDAQINAVATAVIDTQWRGVRGHTPRQTMNGSVRIKLGPGTISGADVLQQVSAYTGIAELQQLEFNSAVLEGTIRDGIMSITKAEVNGPTELAKGMGLMDMRTEEIRIKFDGYVSPALLQRSTFPQVRALGGAAEMAGGGEMVRVPLPVIMSGQVRDPQFTMTWETATAQTKGN